MHRYKIHRTGGEGCVQKLTGDTLKVVLVKFTPLSLAVFVRCVVAWHRQVRPHLDFKTRPRFCPDSLSLFMNRALIFWLAHMIVNNV